MLYYAIRLCYPKFYLQISWNNLAFLQFHLCWCAQTTNLRNFFFVINYGYLVYTIVQHITDQKVLVIINSICYEFLSDHFSINLWTIWLMRMFCRNCNLGFVISLDLWNINKQILLNSLHDMIVNTLLSKFQ